MKSPAPFEGVVETPRDRYRVVLLVAALAAFFLLRRSPRHPLPSPALTPRAGLFQPYCRVDELASGRWEPVPVDGHTWPRLKESRGYRYGLDGNRSATSCYSRDPGLLPVLAATNSWQWVPTGCALRPFDPAGLVQRLAERGNKGRAAAGPGIVFVGGEDSRMQAISLESLLGRHVDRGYLSDRHAFSSVRLEGAAGKVAFSKSDFLVSPQDWRLQVPENDEAPLAANATEDLWTQRLRGNDIVVVNTGALWSPLTPARTARYIDMATQVIEHVDSLQSSTLIVRSAVPTGSDCSDDAATVAANATAHSTFPGKEDADQLNTIWRDLLREHPRHLFLEVPPSPSTCSSSPQTVGAMLSCLPGPIDTWNILLNHILMSTT